MSDDLTSPDSASMMDELFTLRELNANLERLQELQRHNGLAFYVPHAKQDKFHAAGGHKRRYVRTGNRWGKSTAGTAEDIAWCIGERLWYAEGDERRTVGIPQRAVKGCLIVQDWDKADEIFTAQEGSKGKIFQLLPTKSFVGVERSQGGHICKVLMRSKWGGVSVLYIDTVKSFKHNPQGHESSDWDFVHVDEPCPEEMWSAYARGLIDRKGSAWFMCTPLTEMWINDYFIPAGAGRRDFGDSHVFNTDEQKDFWVMTGHSRDNPIVDDESVKAFTRDVPKHELEARLSGTPRELSGLVHKEFCRDVDERGRPGHVYDGCPVGWENEFTPPDHWTIRIAIDPHPKIEMAVLFAATGPTGHTYFWTEIWNKFYVEPLCEHILAALTRTRDGQTKVLEPHIVVCDPLAWTPNPSGMGDCMADIFTTHGVPVQPGSKAMMDGILRTGQLLRERDRFGVPYLQFSSRLTRTLHEFDRYVWGLKDEKTTPLDNGKDHMMENLHRLCMAGLDYVDNNEKAPIVKPLSIGRADLTIPKYEGVGTSRRKLSFAERYRC